MHYNKMKLVVGIFVLTLFFSIVWTFYLVIKEKDIFEKRYDYHFSTDSATGFSVGMPLKLSGFSIGIIDKIELMDNGSVFMTFSVGKKNRKWITDGSILMAIKPLIGSSEIVVFSSMDTKVLNINSTLPLIHNSSIDDIISKAENVLDDIIHVIDNIDTITTYIAKSESDVMKILDNLKKFTTSLEKDDSLLTTITGDEKSTKSVISSLNKTTQIMQELEKLAKNINKTASSLDEKIILPASSAIKEIELIMKDISQKLDVIDGTVKAVGGYENDLIEVREQISVGVAKSNQIIDKINSLMQEDKKNEVTLP